MKRTRWSKWLTVLATVAALGVGQVARAELAAPSMMPGFPMLAGSIVMVMWMPVPGATKYKIFMNGEVKGEAVGPPFQFPAPEAGGKYAIEVAGVDADGSVGPKSGAGSFEIVVLEAPTGLEVRQMDPTKPDVSVRWVAPKGGAIFNVFRQAEGEAAPQLITSVQDSKYNDATVDFDKKYLYTVTAKSVAGKESSPTKPVEFTPKKAVAAVETKKAVGKPWRTTYEVIQPKGVDIGSTNELKIGADGNLYVLDTAGKTILVFDEQLNWLRSIGEGGFLPGQLQGPSGMDILASGNFVIADTIRRKVIVLRPDGETVNEFDVPSASNMLKPDEVVEPRPGGVAVAQNGDLLVVDGTNGRVVVLEPASGKFETDFVHKWSAERQGLGNVKGLAGIAVAPNGDVYVADASRGEVHVFDAAYKPKFLISYGAGAGSFVKVGKMDFDAKRGVSLIPDPMLATVQAFSLETGEYVATLTNDKGELVKDQMPVWTIGSLRNLAVDKKGVVWIIQGIEKNVAKINILE